jgi:hypothetical protein
LLCRHPAESPWHVRPNVQGTSTWSTFNLTLSSLQTNILKWPHKISPGLGLNMGLVAQIVQPPTASLCCVNHDSSSLNRGFCGRKRIIGLQGCGLRTSNDRTGKSDIAVSADSLTLTVWAEVGYKGAAQATRHDVSLLAIIGSYRSSFVPSTDCLLRSSCHGTFHPVPSDRAPAFCLCSRLSLCQCQQARSLGRERGRAVAHHPRHLFREVSDPQRCSRRRHPEP